MKLLTTIIIPEFITHVAKTQNKVAKDSYIKINNNSIYNGAIHRFSRNNVIDNLHKYIINYLPKDNLIDLLKENDLNKLYFKFTFKTVKNHGNIRRNKKTEMISWKKPELNYIPNWDIENLASIWIKVFNDSLIINNNIPDDSVHYLTSVSYEFEECLTINERQIKLEIYGKY